EPGAYEAQQAAAEAAAAAAAAEAEAAAAAMPAPTPNLDKFNEPATPRPAAAPKPRREQSRPQIELPDDMDGEMSAMEMAFAMAGASLDAVDEATGDDDDDTGSEQKNS
ncbi:MAG: hypothetical protein U0075_26465, partial [Thermomicrobiales bacterium]